MSVVTPWIADERWPKDHPRNLIPELCRLFYGMGWVTGTGGGISIMSKEENVVYVAPSGVQKERIMPEDLFKLDPKTAEIVERPLAEGKALALAEACRSKSNTNNIPKPFKQSECTPLFFNAFRMRGAAACIHTHSRNVVLATMLYGDEPEFTLSHVEMIKGIHNPAAKKALMFCDTLVVPIIDNTNFEHELTSSMARAMDKYPNTNAVLVRRHGCYIWGETWEKTKAMAECYDYLFGLAVQMKSLGLKTDLNAKAKL